MFMLAFYIQTDADITKSELHTMDNVLATSLHHNYANSQGFTRRPYMLQIFISPKLVR